ncbi:hypothetical protein TIFTF001_019089 [Ficus carica]|uniref:Mediator complex subunit 15 KIX domain-containing protein n=1 Tax=Ficus carica TaxID=3494 RepID=A0AA88AWE0_FICCA|nr:hypothetical protein TIFTF001_019089 [Ficus carica]
MLQYIGMQQMGLTTSIGAYLGREVKAPAEEPPPKRRPLPPPILDPSLQTQTVFGWFLMANNHSRPVEDGLPADIDWKIRLQPEARQRIVNKIVETLKKHTTFSGVEGLDELKKIAKRFEEKIYTEATTQNDYLRKISLKMLTMEMKRNRKGQIQKVCEALFMCSADSKFLTLLATIKDWVPAMKVPQLKMEYPPWTTAIGRLSCNQDHVNELSTRLETLKKQLPFSGGEGLDELKKIA